MKSIVKQTLHLASNTNLEGVCGLKITIVKYNPKWKIFFENEKEKLKDIFLNQYKTINHIGGTSVENLDSKPIVDISVGVNELRDQDFYIKLLKMHDYKYNTGSKFEEWFLFKKRIKEQKFNLHIMKYNNKRLLDQLIFKYCLTDNEELYSPHA